MFDVEKITAEDVNLDGMYPSDLRAFAKRAEGKRPIAFARQLFPAAPKGYVAATRVLGAYAQLKASAMEKRADGYIQAAIQAEEMCNWLYKRLPEYARW